MAHTRLRVRARVVGEHDLTDGVHVDLIRIGGRTVDGDGRWGRVGWGRRRLRAPGGAEVPTRTSDERVGRRCARAELEIELFSPAGRVLAVEGEPVAVWRERRVVVPVRARRDRDSRTAVGRQ